MPKPTFLQAVLKKPTRSYADPYHSSPWAEQESHESQYYTTSSSRFDEDEYRHAGPSRNRNGRGPSSIASSSVLSDSYENGSNVNSHSLNSRFPKPARRVVSNITLRDGQIIQTPPKKSSSSAIGTASGSGTIRRKKEKASTVAEDENGISTTTRNGTIKKKKKPKSIVTTTIDNQENASTISSPTSTTLSLPMPPPLHSRHSETSSAPSSPIPPLSPVIPTHHRSTENNIVKKPPRLGYQASALALPTPPSSEMSSPSSSSQHVQTVNTAIRSTPAIPQPQKVTRTSIGADSDDDEDVFYTPRTSLTDLQLPEQIVSDIVITPKVIVPPVAPPSFNFLPPTPAPIPDPAHSPFHSEPSSSNSSSLHPDRPYVHRPSPRIEIPQEINFKAGSESATPRADDDAESASGQAGSDDDGEGVYERAGRSSRRPSDSRPASTTWSRPSSVTGRSAGPVSVDGYRPPSRHSTSRSVSRNPSDEFPTMRRPSIPASEVSYQPEGSLRGSISGYGKGGWAAANSSSKSRPTSPVMFMPVSGDGWANFQPPPRQSKFTPLPSSSQNPTFDRITEGTRLGGSSTKGSQNGHYGYGYGDGNGNGHEYGSGLQIPSKDSSPSEYSHNSDGMEMPSRSYVTKDYTSEASQGSVISDDREENESSHQWNRESINQPQPPRPGSLVFPTARVGPSSISHSVTSPSLARPPSRAGSHTNFSRPMSPMMDYSRPTSPMMDRPLSVMSNSTTPRTFNPPSFLNPDLLTILPEMTNEDSDRLYRPTPSESGKSRRTSVQDWNSGNPSRRSSIFRAKSEISHGRDEEEDGLPELPARRSKSVMGFRNLDQDREKDRKWEGSSYGDGVLMESNGRAPESVGGYTNLILPSGAYRPINPAKASSGVDTRILGMPHATMASIVLSTTFSRHSSTPAHLRDQLPSLVDFSSHLKPPTKVGDSQLLVQVYAVAIDQLDVQALDEKGRGDVGKYVPGRSFVGRALSVGAQEKEVVRGDLVIGIFDLRKSGALSEYIIVDRRRVSRAPYPTQLSLEQLSLLPLQGISAARAVRTHLTRHSRAIIMNAHTGIAALVCQEMSRAGVNITAVIPGGDESHENHRACLNNGAKGVLMGSPAAVMLNMEENAWDYVFDTVGGLRVYDAAKRMLKDGGKLVTTVKPDTNFSSQPQLISRPSGIKTLRAAFGSRRKESKFVQFEYLHPTGTGEPEVDTTGMDYRDVMEEPCMAIFKPHLPEFISPTKYSSGSMESLKGIVNFEKGYEVFKRDWEGVRVIRVIN
ncbi:uncharacterized protein IL334_003319 [Kwoniella shivajii]|uniref:Enoyl reductase (ER) domain-containing protein n=1 Tax=Kwoniella shivajii TaxID=564305 RepID=A0ABZ1CYY3_9TREE|nr:hypothetical protein IL334_003319 [Kwoniella shivajii]